MEIPVVRARLGPVFEAAEAASCAIIDLEVLYSAKGPRDYDEIRQRRRFAYEAVPVTPEVLQRALEVQRLLAQRGQHRLPISDLLIAATAESAGLVVLHYDKDFDRIAKVTEQEVEWVVPRGSI